MGIKPEVIESAVNNGASVKVGVDKVVKLATESKEAHDSVVEILTKPSEFTREAATPKEKGSGKTKKSGLGKSIEAKAIEKGMVEKGYDKVAEYEGVDLKEQSQMGADLINSGIDNLMSVVRGEKPLPSGMTNFTAILAAEKYLLKNKNPSLA